MLCSIYNKIYNPNVDSKVHPYRNIYFDNEKNKLEFSMNDDRCGRVITARIEKQDNKYIAYGTERHQLSILNMNSHIRSSEKEIEDDNKFWKWFYNFYNDLRQ